MRVEQVMSHHADVIDADATLAEAASRMRDLVIGALPVLSHGRLVGMVTDRDLAVRGLASGQGGRAARVREVMTHHPITCLPDESAEQAATLMREHGIRRLIVIDRTLAPIGLVSVGDFALYPETQRLVAGVLAGLPVAGQELLEDTFP